MDLRQPLRFLCAAALAAAFVPAAFAQYGETQPRRGGPGTGNPDIQLVPWKYLQTDVLVHDAPITLYWLPASRDQVTQSPLLDSKVFLTASTRCVGYEIVLPDRAAVVHNLGETDKQPAALILDREGKIVRRIERPGSPLLTHDVERLLTDELNEHDQAMYRQMLAASQEATAGRNANAIDLYKKIWDDRCLFPLAGNEAQHALKDLGVIVKETPPATQTTTAK